MNSDTQTQSSKNQEAMRVICLKSLERDISGTHISIQQVNIEHQLSYKSNNNSYELIRSGVINRSYCILKVDLQS